MLILLSYYQQKLPISQFFENCHRSKRNWEIFQSEDAMIILYDVSYKNHGMKLHFCLDRQNLHQFDTCSIFIQYSSKNEFWTKFLKQGRPTICLMRLCVCPSVCPVWNQNLSVCSAPRFTSFIYTVAREMSERKGRYWYWCVSSISLPIEPIQSYAAIRIMSAWYDIANLISSDCFICTDLVERKNCFTSLHFFSLDWKCQSLPLTFSTSYYEK